jgi:aspartate aminotransferase
MITPELQRLLEPLERFEAIRRKVVRLGDRLCDLSYANPYRGAQDEAKAAIRAALEDDRLLGLQYAPFGGQTLARRAAADALRLSHGLPFTFRDVVLTPGAMAALHLALHAAGNPGDEVIIPVPCWLDYPLYARALGLVPVMVPLQTSTFDLDVAAIKGAISQRTCAVVFSHPANPTGRNYSAGALARLGGVLERAERQHGRPITLVADETHRDFTSPGAYRSASEAYDRTMLVYSFGKYHFLQGQRLGYVSVSPRHPDREDVAEEMVRWTRVTGLATPTALMQRALTGLLSLHHDHTWLDHWRKRLLDELAEQGYTVVPADSTMFIYLQTPDGHDDFEFVTKLAVNGVLVLPAPVFHHAGYFRLSLTGSEHMLERALPVLARLAPA